MMCGTVDPVTSEYLTTNSGSYVAGNVHYCATWSVTLQLHSQKVEVDKESSFLEPAIYPPHAGGIEHETALTQLKSRKCVSFDFR
jgi:hypothetical protein